MIANAATFEKELDELCKDMSEHVKYLRDCTYNNKNQQKEHENTRLNS